MRKSNEEKNSATNHLNELKKLLKSIKDDFKTPEDSFEFFKTFSSKKELGIIAIDKNTKKFDIRGENTPSVTAYDRLSYVDYGGEGKKRDVIHLMLETNSDMKFGEAIILLSEWLKEDVSDLLKKSIGKSEQKQNKEKPYTDFYIGKQIEERNKIENKDIFNNICKGLFRSCSIEEMKRGVKAFNIGLNSYDKTILSNKDDGTEEEITQTEYRLFIPECDENNIAYGSYRYNRDYVSNKGLLRRNSKRVLFGSHLLKYFKKEIPIIVSEGHSDVIVNISKYLQCVTTGSSTTKITPYLHLLKGFELHFYPDADQPGIKGVTNKIISIEHFNKNLPEKDKIKYKVFLWGKGFFEQSIDDFKELYIPMNELKNNPSLKKFSKKWWIPHFNDDNLSSTITIDIMQKEQNAIIIKELEEYKEEINIPEEALLKNWKILTKNFVKQGFDFIDFHSKYQESGNKYFKFINKYKFK